MLNVSGMCIGYWRVSQNVRVWPFDIFALVVLSLLVYLPTKYREITSRNVIWYGPKFKRPGRLLLIMFAGITGIIFPTLILIALISNLISVSRIIVAFKENRKLATIINK